MACREMIKLESKVDEHVFKEEELGLNFLLEL